MKQLILAGVAVKLNAVILDTETQTASVVDINPVLVPAAEWPAWAVEVWPDLWENLCKEQA